MATTPAARAMPRLRRLVTGARVVPAAGGGAAERCGLCAAALTDAHAHLMDLRARVLLCACRACAVLFDRRAAGMGQYRRMPERWRLLDDFALTDEQWSGLGVPVAMAFFSYSTGAGRVVGYYPGPLGAAETMVDIDTWRAIEHANPVLSTMEPDVEALLVDRRGHAAQHWLVALDVCYALVGLIRTGWKGLGGGPAVQEQITQFFDALRGRRMPKGSPA